MAQKVPAHVNQFSAGGRFPNGSSSTRYDCMVSCGVMELDAATGGAIVPSTTTLRGRQSDQDPDGIGLNDLAVAFRATPGAPTLSYGSKSWATIVQRGQAGDGTILTGFYWTLGKHRAPGSEFRGPHAIRLQRVIGNSATGALVARVNDPLRTGAVDLPLSAVRAFYFSGIGQAGWSTGAAAVGVGAGGSGGSGQQLGAFLDQVSFPVGHVITAADIQTIMDTLHRNGWFSSQGPVAGAVAATQYRQLLERVALGQPWTKALQDRLAAEAGNLATAAGDPFGLSTGLAGLVAGVSEIARNGILLIAILGIVLMGLWLVATAPDNPLPRPRLPIPGG